MHYKGEGVPQDYAQALGWFRKAAEQGNPDAQSLLGFMYTKGEGVPQDDAQAASLYRKAAEQSDAYAQFNLGVMYAKGYGVPQDYSLAYALYSLSATFDLSADNPATTIREKLKSKMTPKQIEAGQQLTLELAKPNNLTKAIDAYLRKKSR